MRSILLIVPLLATACSFPSYRATKTVDLEVPVEQATRLHCKTHNGAIKVTRGDSATAVRIHAEMTARGHTQDEADANLQLLDIGRAHDGDTLRIFGEYPRDVLAGTSPTFAFTLEVPEQLALTLRTHNGGVATAGTAAPVDIETHNGAVSTDTSSTVARVKTHNGAVRVRLDAPGALDADIETHNGGVLVELHDDCHGWMTAATHNGGMSYPAGVREVTIERRSVRCRIGPETTAGKLNVRSHNGAIRVR